MSPLLLLTVLAFPAAAQQQELGLTLGQFTRQDRTSSLSLDGGMALQANYGYGLFSNGAVSVLGEVHFLASPLRVVTSSSGAATRDVATIFITPGIRVKFIPNGRVTPYGAIGGGWSILEHSLLTIGGANNPAPRTANSGVFAFGGGVDVKVWNWLGLRGEIRDFYSASPVFNVPAVSGRQHNVVIGGGFVLRFGGSK
jgi:opacity protein-like surface antigen